MATTLLAIAAIFAAWAGCGLLTYYLAKRSDRKLDAALASEQGDANDQQYWLKDSRDSEEGGATFFVLVALGPIFLFAYMVVTLTEPGSGSR